MAAMQVALDPKVSDKAFRVFVVIGAFKPKNSNIVNVGQRRIAKLMQKSQWYVSTRVKELRKSGWLGTRQVASGKRQFMFFLSEAYGAKAVEAEGIAGAGDAPGHAVFQMPGRTRKRFRPAVFAGSASGRWKRSGCFGGAGEVGAESHA